MGATSAATSNKTMGVALGSAVLIAFVVLLICLVAIPRWRKAQKQKRLQAADADWQQKILLQRPISTGIFAGTKRQETWDPERLVGTAPQPVKPVTLELRPLPSAVVKEVYSVA